MPNEREREREDIASSGIDGTWRKFERHEHKNEPRARDWKYEATDEGDSFRRNKRIEKTRSPRPFILFKDFAIIIISHAPATLKKTCTEKKWKAGAECWLLLTDDIEADELTAMRLSGHLTLVQSGVSGLREFDLQRPVLCRSWLDDSETLVGRVRVSTHRQDVDVTMPDPAHLHPKKKKMRRRN